MKVQPLRDKAESFVAHAKLFALGSWKPFVELKPHLWQAISEDGRGELTFEQKCFKWDFLLMVAMAWWTVNSARIELPKSDFDSVADILEQRIAEWNRGTVPAFSDLNNFVCRYDSEYQKISDIQKVVDFTKLLVGTWVLWNLTNKARFEDEAALATMLGRLVHASVAGYWHESESNPA
jgi:hypothetical protein